LIWPPRRALRPLALDAVTRRAQQSADLNIPVRLLELECNGGSVESRLAWLDRTACRSAPNYWTVPLAAFFQLSPPSAHDDTIFQSLVSERNESVRRRIA
jgi:hypothetical protein